MLIVQYPLEGPECGIHKLLFHSSHMHFLPFIEVSLNDSSTNMIVMIAVLLSP